MTRRLFIVADRDEEVQLAVASAASTIEAIELIACSTAGSALDACTSLEPDCLIADATLRDADGLWLASAIRAKPEPIASIPILVLAAHEHRATRLHALQGGADVALGKPFDPRHLMAQVHALVAMTERHRGQVAARSRSPGRLVAFRGDPRQFPITSLLGGLELEQRSGELALTTAGSGRRLVLAVASGRLVGGRLDSLPLGRLDALREALRWPGLGFEFVAGPSRPAPTDSESLGTLLLAASPLADERSHEAPPDGGDGVLSAFPDEAAAALDAVPSTAPAPSLSAERPDASSPLDRAAPNRSGTRTRVDREAPRPPPQAPGRKLRESVAPALRPDPRAELAHESSPRGRRG